MSGDIGVHIATWSLPACVLLGNARAHPGSADCWGKYQCM